MKKIIIFLLTLIPTYFFLYPHSFSLRSEKTNMTTSIIVPCIPKHFHFLFDLLQSYKNQTSIPNEVVISLSQYKEVDPLKLQELEAYPWPFTLKIIKHEGKKLAGENRNSACDAATGEIIICNDADDLPHFQRVEIIKYFFEKYKIVHLMHCWHTNISSNFLTYSKELIPFHHFRRPASLIKCFMPIHFGNCAFLRSLMKSVKWNTKNSKGDEDLSFTLDIYKNFKKEAIVIYSFLINYRYEYSSFRVEAKN